MPRSGCGTGLDRLAWRKAQPTGHNVYSFQQSASTLCESASLKQALRRPETTASAASSQPSAPALRVLGRAEVSALANLDVSIQLMATALTAVARGHTRQALRQILDLPSGGGRCLSVMFGSVSEPACFGAKVTAVMPGHRRLGLQSHMGVVILFDEALGFPLAVLHGGELTGLRTAAASAAATRKLARPDAKVLAVVGAGEQAERHVQAMCAVRGITEVRIWGRDPAAAARMTTHIQAQAWLPAGAVLKAVETVAQAVRGADIVCTVSGSQEPLLEGHLLEPGMHLNVVGSSTAVAREIDDFAVSRSRLFVDYLPMALAEGGELRHAIASGAVLPSHVLGEVGAVIGGWLPGRVHADDITLFKSLGMPAEDLFMAEHLYGLALASDCGVSVPF